MKEKVGGMRALNRLSGKDVAAFIKHPPSEPHAKLHDGGGLYLTRTPAGTLVWRIKYRHNGAERTFTVGTHRETSIDAARAARDKVRVLVKSGQDPVQQRRVEKAQRVQESGNTFEAIAAQWLEKNRKGWSQVHYTKSKQALERDVFPFIGKLPVAQISTAMVAHMTKRIADRDAVPTAERILRNVRKIFSMAKIGGLRENPAIGAEHILPENEDSKKMPALLTFPELGDVMRRAEVANVSRAVRMAHRLVAFTAARIANVVEAKWSEFDLNSETPIWTIPRKQMKVKKGRVHPHKVILGPTIAAELREWRNATSGEGFLFPSSSKRGHVTKEALEKFYRETLALRDKHSPHGWRASLSTLANENKQTIKVDKDAIEFALDHVDNDEVARAYDRGERLDQRIKLAKWWDSELAQAQAGAQVLKLHA